MATEVDRLIWLMSNQYLEMGLDIDGMLASVDEKHRRVEASKSFVSNLPTVQLVPAAIANPDLDVCAVCMEEFNQSRSNEYSIKQVPCGHVYHENCITNWLSNNSSCPLCRFKFSINHG